MGPTTPSIGGSFVYSNLSKDKGDIVSQLAYKEFYFGENTLTIVNSLINLIRKLTLSRWVYCYNMAIRLK